MRCLGVKGGIGSASRILSFDNRDYTIGCLLMSNFGAAGNLKIEGKSIATRRIDDELIDKMVRSHCPGYRPASE